MKLDKTMKIYCIELVLKVKLELIPQLLLEVITLLNFEPYKMDVFYNEFKNPKYKIPYDPKYLISNFSKKEVDGGITTISLYDKKYSEENSTPFFRFKIDDTTLNNDLVTCVFEWIGYENLDWLLKDDYILKILLKENVELVYLIAYNQFDTFQETNKWNKKIIINGISFMAAPLMYFGKEYNDILPISNFLKLNDYKKIIINGKEIIKIELFPLYENPNKYKKIQKDYWKKMNLTKEIKKFKKKTHIPFSEFLKRRSRLSKK